MTNYIINKARDSNQHICNECHCHKETMQLTDAI